MNRYEFYNHLLNYKNNSLAHSDINKYYRKVDLGGGKWRYFYSKEEYDAYENNKKLQGASKDNAKGAGSDYQRYLDEQKAKKAEEERLEQERRAEISRRNDQGRDAAIKKANEEAQKRAEISRRNDQGRYEAIQKATGGVPVSSISSAMDLANIKDYVSGDVKTKVADVINSISNGSNIDMNSINNVLSDLKKDLDDVRANGVSGIDLDSINKTLKNINDLKGIIKDYNKNGMTNTNYSNAVDLLRNANMINGNTTKKESTPTTGHRVIDWLAGTVMPWLFGLFS